MRIFLLILLLALTGCAPSPSGGPAPGGDASARGQIHPPTGVESLNLGAGQADVEKALGKPEATDNNEFNPKQSYWLYYSKGLELSFNEGKLDSIVCHRQEEKWSAYPGATAEGLSVLSSREDFEKALGKPATPLAQALKYKDKGLWIRFDKDGKTESISLMNPKDVQ